MQQTSGWVRVAIVLWSAMGVWLLALWGLTWLALEERAQRTDWATAWQQVAPLWGLCWALGGAALLGMISAEVFGWYGDSFTGQQDALFERQLADVTALLARSGIPE